MSDGCRQKTAQGDPELAVVWQLSGSCCCAAEPAGAENEFFLVIVGR